jgi:hypothetical protein
MIRSSSSANLRCQYPSFFPNVHNRKTTMHVQSFLISVLVLLGVSVVTDMAGPFFSAILASAPTGTPLALYLAHNSPSASSTAQERLVDATGGLVSGTLCTGECFSFSHVGTLRA